ncbi:MAG TPA: signal recognition particle subunit SRP19/SEC65 family protein [Nitrososphaeraceae archaeon]|nr:signal recognition particle subunit SRP19/SEC65 family protein [Nitrososphaeraceae archaeon]
MKDYDHVILWLDYFNRNLSRSKGRRVKRDKSVFDPSLLDLIDAAKAAGYDLTNEETNDQARYPRRAFVKSSYIMILKSNEVKKSVTIRTIADKMVQKRNK